MRVLLLFILVLFISCTEGPDSVESDNVYRVDCKTPIGEVRTYYISEGEYKYCYHWQSGIFDFKNLDGVQIKSSFCHIEGVPIDLGK
jgi:hypothetical protein